MEKKGEAKSEQIEQPELEPKSAESAMKNQEIEVGKRIRDVEKTAKEENATVEEYGSSKDIKEMKEVSDEIIKKAGEAEEEYYERLKDIPNADDIISKKKAEEAEEEYYDELKKDIPNADDIILEMDKKRSEETGKDTKDKIKNEATKKEKVDNKEKESFLERINEFKNTIEKIRASKDSSDEKIKELDNLFSVKYPKIANSEYNKTFEEKISGLLNSLNSTRKEILNQKETKTGEEAEIKPEESKEGIEDAEESKEGKEKEEKELKLRQFLVGTLEDISILKKSEETISGKKSGMQGILSFFKVAVKAFEDVIKGNEELSGYVKSTKETLDNEIKELEALEIEMYPPESNEVKTDGSETGKDTKVERETEIKPGDSKETGESNIKSEKKEKGNIEDGLSKDALDEGSGEEYFSEDGDQAVNNEGEMRKTNKEVIMGTKTEIKNGEHLITEVVMNSTIKIKSGSKLTINKTLMKSNIVVEKGGLLEIGENVVNMKSNIKYE